MIILRERIFTFGEQRALKEIYDRTGGLKGLPRISKAGDAIRFDKLANGMVELIKGNKDKFDKEEVRKLLLNNGFHESAKELDHFVDKYGNLEAIKKLNRLKSRYPKQDTNKDSGNIESNSIISNNLIQQDSNFTKQIYPYISSEPSENEKAVFNRIHRRAKDKLGIGKVQVSANPPTSNITSNIQIHYGETTDPQGNIIRSDSIPEKSIITLRSRHPGPYSHEIGHLEHSKSTNGKENRINQRNIEKLDKTHPLIGITNDMLELSDENYATSKGLARMKVEGADQTTTCFNKDILGKCHDTYFNTALKNNKDLVDRIINAKKSNI